jgi:hypothetical protein
MGKASKKPVKSATSKAVGAASAEPSVESTTRQATRRSKRALDPAVPPQQNPFFYVAVGMVIFVFALLFQLSDKIYARYFEDGKEL